MKRIVVLTGAGISAESGIRTFRDSDGLWEQHRIEDVATPEAWQRNPKLVLEFYNQRRKQLLEASPNEAHKALIKLEETFEVQIITQNVDDLHERAGSTNVLHLHGELKKARSTVDENYICEIEGADLVWGDKCPKGAQLRPHIVWFGEAVPLFEPAIELAKTASVYIIIGTSLNVYPAAGLGYYIPDSAQKYYIDPKADESIQQPNLTIIKEKAGIGVPALVKALLQKT